MRLTLRATLVLLALLVFNDVAAVEHPCLYLTPQEVVAVRARYQTLPWAQAIGAKILNKAQEALAKTPDIPHAGGQWAGHYVCKACGVGLKFETATDHSCPNCKQVYHGGIFDQVGITRRHGRAFSQMMQMALAYVLDPQPAYAQRIRDMLVEYAGFYPDLILHDFRGMTGDQCAARGARLSAQTLEESGMLVMAARAYDIVYENSVFSADDHALIEKRLIRAMAATIQRNPWGRLNWQSDHNAALVSAGYLLGDQALITQAIDDPANGFRFQMREGVLASGMWYEGAVSYHFRALHSHMVVLEAARRNGLNLYELPQVRMMFTAPLDLLMPDNTFPPLNDSHRSNIKESRETYEIAYRRYGDPRFGRLLMPRESNEALFWGADDVAPSDDLPPAMTCRTGSADGLSILRNPSGTTALYLDSFTSTAQHTQPVRLHLLLYAQDEIRFVDPGTMPYGHPMHEGWGRQAFAHNTVVVNEENQSPSNGTLKAFATGDGWSVARAQALEAYPGVVLDRTVLMRSGIIADVVRCTADAVSTFDVPLHLRGELSGLPEGEALAKLSDSPAYREAKDVRRLSSTPEQICVDTGKGRRIIITIIDRSEMFSAKAYGKDLTDMVPMIMRRQRGTQADFIAVYQILEAGAQPLAVRAETGSDIIVRCGDTVLSVGKATAVTVGGVRRVVDIGESQPSDRP